MILDKVVLSVFFLVYGEICYEVKEGKTKSKEKKIRERKRKEEINLVWMRMGGP